MRIQRDWQNLVASSQTMAEAGMRGWDRGRAANSSSVFVGLSFTTCLTKVEYSGLAPWVVSVSKSRWPHSWEVEVASCLRGLGLGKGMTSLLLSSISPAATEPRFKAKGHRHILMGEVPKTQELHSWKSQSHRLAVIYIYISCVKYTHSPLICIPTIAGTRLFKLSCLHVF